MALYFLGFVVMFFWVAAEGQVVLAIGSFLYAGVIGLLVTKRRYPILAGFLIVLSCLGLVGALVLPSLMKPAKVAWRDFQPAEEMFSVQMPTEPAGCLDCGRLDHRDDNWPDLISSQPTPI